MGSTPGRWKGRTRALAAGFLGFFADRQLRVVDPVPVSSGVDPSVRFVGSTISVFKPCLHDPPAPGLCLAQPALRTQNLPRLLGDAAPLKWSSVFDALGMLSPADHLDRVAHWAHAWLTGPAGVPADRLVVCADASDEDLLAAVRGAGWRHVDLDGLDPRTYRHAFGLAGVDGRNVNIALRGADGGLGQFANVIVIQRAGTPVAVELAVGASALLACLADLDHPLQASPVADVLPTGTDHERRLADALAAATLLLGEGLRPVSRGRGGILRRYLLALGGLLREDDRVESIGEAAGLLAGDAAVGAQLERDLRRLDELELRRLRAA